MLPIIDTHQHMWDLRRFSLPWLSDVDALDRSYSMDDYLSASSDSGVAKTIYMEVDVDPLQRNAEIDFISQLCLNDDNPMVAAVIAGSPGDHDFNAKISVHNENPYVKGVRQVLHVPSMQRAACLEPAFVSGLNFLGSIGKSFDLCMRPSELADATEVVKKCTDTQFIIDHCGNADPQIVAGISDPEINQPFAHTRQQWLDDIAALGQCANVVCKLSGIIARVQLDWDADLLAPTIKHCIDSFGCDRVIVGGDWPVCTLGAPLDQWLKALRQIVGQYSDLEQRQIFSENALRIYGLD